MVQPRPARTPAPHERLRPLLALCGTRPATLLCYWLLWAELGHREGHYDTTLVALGAVFGVTKGAAWDWLEQLVDLGLVEICERRRGRRGGYRLYVRDPEALDAPRRLAADPQLTLPGISPPQDAAATETARSPGPYASAGAECLGADRFPVGPAEPASDRGLVEKVGFRPPKPNLSTSTSKEDLYLTSNLSPLPPSQREGFRTRVEGPKGWEEAARTQPFATSGGPAPLDFGGLAQRLLSGEAQAERVEALAARWQRHLADPKIQPTYLRRLAGLVVEGRLARREVDELIAWLIGRKLRGPRHAVFIARIKAKLTAAGISFTAEGADSRAS